MRARSLSIRAAYTRLQEFRVGKGKVTNIKVGDTVSINPYAVVCVGRHYDWVSVGKGAKGKVMEIEYNIVNKTLEARVRICETEWSYWFYLDDLTKEDENNP